MLGEIDLAANITGPLKHSTLASSICNVMHLQAAAATAAVTSLEEDPLADTAAIFAAETPQQHHEQKNVP